MSFAQRKLRGLSLRIFNYIENGERVFIDNFSYANYIAVSNGVIK